MRYFLTILILLLGLNVAAYADDKHFLSVTGTGQVTTQPDTVSLTVGTETEAETAEAARNANADIMQATMRAIHSLKLSHLTLQTSGYYVYPRTKYQDKKQVKYYQATNSLTVKLEEPDSEKLALDAGRILDAALSVGANTTSGP